MIALVAITIICYVLYVLFVKGMVWGILLFVGGVYGIRLGLLNLIPQTSHTIMTFLGYPISIAAFTATVITALGLAYFAKE